MRSIKKLDITMKGDDVVKRIQLNLNGRNGNQKKGVILTRLPKARQLFLVKNVFTIGNLVLDMYSTNQSLYVNSLEKRKN